MKFSHRYFSRRERRVSLSFRYPFLYFFFLPFLAGTILNERVGRAEDNEQVKLGRGELIIQQKDIKGTTVPQLTSYGVIDAPPSDVWAIIENCSKYPQNLVRVISAKEISRKGSVVRCKVTIDMPFGMDDLTSVTDAIHTVQPGKLYKRKWTLVKGNYSINSGEWIITPFSENPKRSLVVYVIHAVPNNSIPAYLLKLAQRKAIPGLFHKLRQQVQ